MPRLPLPARLDAALKAFRGTSMVHSGAGGGDHAQRDWWLFGTLPGSNYDYERAAGRLWLNSAVSACIAWMQRTFPEARLQVTGPGEPREPIPNHPLVRLIERPNPAYSGDLLWQATLLSWVVDGNAFWIKARGDQGQGRPLELWYVPHWQVVPQWPASGATYISHYLYRVDGKEVKLDPRDVVHFRFGLDPQNSRLGLSPLKAALREVAADNEMSTYTAALLRNMGVPGAVISAADANTTFGDKGAKKLRDLWKARTTGDQRGEPLVLDAPVKVDKLALSPEELVLDKIRNVPEDRICAALGIPPMVVGLSSGAQHKTYANYAEAREAAFENCVIPTQKLMGCELQLQLLPDLGDPERERVEWDYSAVRVLQEDQDQLWSRVVGAKRDGVLTVNEARAFLGLPPVEGGDVLAAATPEPPEAAKDSEET